VTGCGQKRQPVRRGDPAPEIQAKDLQGKAITLDDYKGRVVLVLFWAEACCADAIPAITELFDTYKDAGFAVIAINPVEPQERVERVVKAFKVDFVVGLDQLKLTQRRYDVHGVPCSFLVDRVGVIREKILGDIPKHKLENKLQALLK
jgi:peroxiredoxin